MVDRYFLIAVLLVLSLVGAAGAVESERLQDPLRPVRYQAPLNKSRADDGHKKAVPNWHLSAVLLSDARAVAVIDGVPCQVGDLVEGYRVVKIEGAKVLLKNNRRKVVLRRAGTGLKKVSSPKDVGKGSHP